MYSASSCWCQNCSTTENFYSRSICRTYILNLGGVGLIYYSCSILSKKSAKGEVFFLQNFIFKFIWERERGHSITPQMPTVTVVGPDPKPGAGSICFPGRWQKLHDLSHQSGAGSRNQTYVLWCAAQILWLLGERFAPKIHVLIFVAKKENKQPQNVKLAILALLKCAVQGCWWLYFMISRAFSYHGVETLLAPENNSLSSPPPSPTPACHHSAFCLLRSDYFVLLWRVDSGSVYFLC